MIKLVVLVSLILVFFIVLPVKAAATYSLIVGLLIFAVLFDAAHKGRRLIDSRASHRVSVVFGFHRRAAVLNATTRCRGEMVTYDEARIHENSRVIQLAIDARAQRWPEELRYLYQPLAAEEDDNRWSAETREKVLKNYNLTNLLL